MTADDAAEGKVQRLSNMKEDFGGEVFCFFHGQSLSMVHAGGAPISSFGIVQKRQPRAIGSAQPEVVPPHRFAPAEKRIPSGKECQGDFSGTPHSRLNAL